MPKPPPEGPAPYTRWNSIWRGLFSYEYQGHLYQIDVDYFDFGERICLYRDGKLQDFQRTKGTWVLEDGARIEARLQTYGMRHVRIVLPDGTTNDFVPATGSAEKGRQDLHRRHPVASKVVSVVSTVILVVALVLALPQWVSMVLAWFDIEWQWLALPVPFTSVITVLAIIAGIERASAFRKDSYGG